KRELKRLESLGVISHVEGLFFTCHGIPEVLCTDNRPQYIGQAFDSFAAAYGFKHITSSPRYLQGNAEAERAVQTEKNQKNAEDPYLCGYSSAQLLMGLCLCNRMPTLPSQLDPKLPDSASFAGKEKEKALSDAANYSKRHRARALGVLLLGAPVMVTDMKSSDTILQNHSTLRSYLHLIPLWTPTSLPQQRPPEPFPTEAPMSPAVVPQVLLILRTKSGTAIVKPNRLDL
uniref:Integrase catalytic domain-containing protein n=1 Tax=Mola mola TaxID=94237 RepID=A0A3Q4BDZ6_MOLML